MFGSLSLLSLLSVCVQGYRGATMKYAQIVMGPAGAGKVMGWCKKRGGR